jgi:hypothetical protein
MFKQISFINKFALIALFVFSSCQKDDQVVNSIDDYFPLQVGNYWEFKSYNGQTFKYQIDSVKNLDGVNYFRMLRSATDTIYYRKDPYWKVYERRRTTAEVLKFDFGVPAGYRWALPPDPAFNNRIWMITLQSKTDTVKSNHDTFEHCCRYYIDIETVADEEYWWVLAPGVGFVKNWNAWFPPSRLIKAKINGVEREY